ncbi:MAG: tRNA (guanosine(46)-N7)-methyltransferase TrmB [Pseudomonadota bacterium]
MSATDQTPDKRRTIRSFVRRAGRMTQSQAKALAELWPIHGVEYSGGKIDFPVLFGNASDTVLEIGFGNGDSLVELAAAKPKMNFLGVEVHEPGIGHCLIGIRDAGIDNLKLVCHDAMEVLETGIAAGSLSRINLYFPDPWPKKRHHKRRIVAPRFLDLCHAALKPGGTLHIATDWDNYAEHIDEALAADPRYRLSERRVHDGDRPLERSATKFERRGLKRGHRIHDWCFERRA